MGWTTLLGASCGDRVPRASLSSTGARRWRGYWLVGCIVTVLCLLFGMFGGMVSSFADPSPEGWDPLEPSPAIVTVDAYEPDTLRQAFTLTAYGSLAQFDLQAVAGHDVIVYGYGHDPYLRVDADGGAFVNDRSASVAINGDGSGSIPPSSLSPSAAADPGPPVWRALASKGLVFWHDHRIHWMQAGVPPTQAGGVIEDWDIEVQVDGRDGRVSGRVLRDPEVGWDQYRIAVGGPYADPVPTSSTPYLLALGAVAILGGGVLIFGRRPWVARRRRR